jgi:hypothetical protein
VIAFRFGDFAGEQHRLKQRLRRGGLNFARRVMNCGWLAGLSCSTLFSSPGQLPTQHSRKVTSPVRFLIFERMPDIEERFAGNSDDGSLIELKANTLLRLCIR